ncbi:hypothetical protein BJX65DRAFT_288640 [Aspergillus insuetus]
MVSYAGWITGLCWFLRYCFHNFSAHHRAQGLWCLDNPSNCHCSLQTLATVASSFSKLPRFICAYDGFCDPGLFAT